MAPEEACESGFKVSLASSQQPQSMGLEGQEGVGYTLQTLSVKRGVDFGRTSSVSSTSRFPGSNRKMAKGSCTGEP